MTNNYDAAAWFYDDLSKMVFGNAIKNIQIALIKHLPPKSKILIVGGGTGWILEEINKVQPAGLEITYVEISSKMLELSKKRQLTGNKVHFIHSSIENYITDSQYDIIFTAFLFDNFAPEKIKKNFHLLHQYLKPNGLWLIADFHIANNRSRFWQKIVIKMMLIFFKILCNVEARTLIAVDPLFLENEYKAQNTYYQFRQFMKAVVYIKP